MGAGSGGGAFDPTQNQQEVGSTWLVVSGPAGSKATEAFGTEAEATVHAETLTARGVDAEVRELVKLAYPLAVSVDVERAGCGDVALLSALLAKALLRAADGVLDGGLAAARSGPTVARERSAPKIVVPRLVPPRMPRRGRKG